jgi:hypothetical protein
MSALRDIILILVISDPLYGFHGPSFRCFILVPTAASSSYQQSVWCAVPLHSRIKSWLPPPFLASYPLEVYRASSFKHNRVITFRTCAVCLPILYHNRITLHLFFYVLFLGDDVSSCFPSLPSTRYCPPPSAQLLVNVTLLSHTGSTTQDPDDIFLTHLAFSEHPRHCWTFTSLLPCLGTCRSSCSFCSWA